MHVIELIMKDGYFMGFLSHFIWTYETTVCLFLTCVPQGRGRHAILNRSQQ